MRLRGFLIFIAASATKVGFPGGSAVKNLLVSSELQEAWVRSLGWEDPLEEFMATPSSMLAWRIPWTEEPGGLQSIGPHRVVHNFSDLAGTIKVEQKFFF